MYDSTTSKLIKPKIPKIETDFYFWQHLGHRPLSVCARAITSCIANSEQGVTWDLRRAGQKHGVALNLDPFHCADYIKANNNGVFYPKAESYGSRWPFVWYDKKIPKLIDWLENDCGEDYLFCLWLLDEYRKLAA